MKTWRRCVEEGMRRMNIWGHKENESCWWRLVIVLQGGKPGSEGALEVDREGRPAERPIKTW